MGPVEFIKTCFAIACVMAFGVISIKVSFALVDWLVERIKNEGEKKMDQEQHSYSFLNFKKYSRNYLKTFTKEELIDYIDMIYNNWSGMDISAKRVSKLGIETYKKLLINREALKLFVDWAEECDFGYDQLPEEYEKYKTDLEEKGLDYCEGLRYIAIQEAKKALKVYENHIEMMDEKLDEWEQGERK